METKLLGFRNEFDKFNEFVYRRNRQGEGGSPEFNQKAHARSEEDEGGGNNMQTFDVTEFQNSYYVYIYMCSYIHI